MLKESTDQFNSSLNIEIAILAEPLPKWIGKEFASLNAGIVDVALRIISPEMTDALPPEALSALIFTTFSDEVSFDAWLSPGKDHLKKLLDEYGRGIIKGVSISTDQQSVSDSRTCYEVILDKQYTAQELLDKKPQQVILSCHRSFFRTIGLPDIFLTPMTGGDRIGVDQVNDRIDLTRYPDINELLDAYKIVISPGGEHYTDCFFLSKRVPVNEIVRQLEKSAKALGWSVSLLGEISGKQYDDIYNKILLEVMTNM